MSISTIQSALSASSIQPIVASQTPPAPVVDPGSAVSGVSVDISQPGQLFSQLASLAQSDPAQFKSVTADIAQKLSDAASSQTGAQAEFLKRMADNFTAASQSGNPSDILPKVGQGGGHHGGHHHHHAAAATSTAPDGSSTDPLGELVQGIVSTALDSSSSSSSSSSLSSSSSSSG